MKKLVKVLKSYSFVVSLVSFMKFLKDLALRKYASTPVINNRRKICNDCDMKIQADVERCSVCFCAIRKKTLYRSSECPLKKW